MIWAVVAEAVAIGVLTLFVLALAHAYAGLAAAARSDDRRAPDVEPWAISAAADRQTEEAPDAVHGVTPDGEAVVIPLVGVEHRTLLAFFSSTCASCRGLLERLGTASHALGPDVRTVVVAKGPERESPSELRRLVGDASDVDVVLSSATWGDLAVPGSPYFVLVDGGSGGVLGEGTAGSWSQVAGLLSLSTGDALAGPRGSRAGARAREEEVDRELRAAGVLPGDASLYPPSTRARAS